MRNSPKTRAEIADQQKRAFSRPFSNATMANTAELTYFGRDLEAMSFARNYHEWIADEFAPYLGEEVAEVGAGSGDFTELILERGAKRVSCFEPSNNVYPILEDRHRDRKGVETIQSYFGEKLDENRERFDSAVYVNVLEHVERDREEVGIAYEALKPGGHLAILVPALEWLYSEFDSQLGHFRRYRKQSLASLLEDQGFEIQEAKYFDMAGIMPWYLLMVMFNKTLNSGNVSAYDKLVIPVTRFLEGKWAPAIGKNLLVVGRKAGCKQSTVDS